MKKVLNILYCILFLSIMIIPLCLTDTRNNVKSDLDNRVLVELPKKGEWGIIKGIEKYLQDRIGLRDRMVTGYQLVNNLVAKELTHPIYTYGQDGYMFFKMHNNVQYSSYHQLFAETVVKMSRYCESNGVPFYFMFDPEKISVYRRYLPKGVNYNDEWVDQLLAYLVNHDVKVVNNRDLLIQKSYSEQVFNQQYDAGHWNDLGCFYGTNNLWKTVHKDFPAVEEYTFEDFDIGTKEGKYLASSKFPVNEEVPVFVLKDEWLDVSADYNDIKLDSRYPYFAYYINQSTDAEKYPKMLIFHGSYYNRGPKFFIGRAREYIGIHDYQNVLDLDYYFNLFKPELVVFEVAEYTVSDGYFDSQKMRGLNFSEEKE